ncbi:MAG TPA: hypothetical protein VHL34_22625 [Rhizomicrobium sp.]|nr:hypothetical protein [Rhizomicrobium sp.]
MTEDDLPPHARNYDDTGFAESLGGVFGWTLGLSVFFAAAAIIILIVR